MEKKSFMLIFFCLLKKLFLQKIKKIYISFEKYFFIQNIYIHSAKKLFFDHKKYICRNLIWSLKFQKRPVCGIS